MTSAGLRMFFQPARPVHDFRWCIMKRIQNNLYKWMSCWKAHNVGLAISNQINFPHTSNIDFIVGISWFTWIVQISSTSIVGTLWRRWVRFVIPYEIHVVITQWHHTSKKRDSMSPEENNLLTRDVVIKCHAPPLKKVILLVPEDNFSQARYICYLLKTSHRYHSIHQLSRFIPL